MKKGIPCFDCHETCVKEQNRIEFRFVSEGNELSSSCTISLGDPDPVTGRAVTDVKIFREYHLLRNREIYYNKKAACVPFGRKEKAEREHLRQQIAEDFEKKYGYAPDRGTLDWLVSERYPKLYRVEIDSFVNAEGESLADSMEEFADPAAAEALRTVEEEFEASMVVFMETLKPVQQDVFRLLRLKAEGMNIHGMGKLLAEKWGVENPDISYAKKQVGKKLVKWMEQ